MALIGGLVAAAALTSYRLTQRQILAQLVSLDDQRETMMLRHHFSRQLSRAGFAGRRSLKGLHEFIQGSTDGKTLIVWFAKAPGRALAGEIDPQKEEWIALPQTFWSAASRQLLIEEGKLSEIVTPQADGFSSSQCKFKHSGLAKMYNLRRVKFSFDARRGRLTQKIDARKKEVLVDRLENGQFTYAVTPPVYLAAAQIEQQGAWSQVRAVKIRLTRPRQAETEFNFSLPNA